MHDTKVLLRENAHLKHQLAQYKKAQDFMRHTIEKLEKELVESHSKVIQLENQVRFVKHDRQHIHALQERIQTLEALLNIPGAPPELKVRIQMIESLLDIPEQSLVPAYPPHAAYPD